MTRHLPICQTCTAAPLDCHLCPVVWVPELCPVCGSPDHKADDCPGLLAAGEVPGVTSRAAQLGDDDPGESRDLFMKSL